MSQSYSSSKTAEEAAAPTVWWAQPLPVICLMIVLIVFIEKFDWRSMMSGESRSSSSPAIASGTLYSVRYDLGGGRVGGLTRAGAIESGVNGEWNLDLHATLTKEALIIHRLKPYEGGNRPIYDSTHPQVIPFDRIYDVQFGDHGIVLPRTEAAHDHSHSH